MKHPSKPWKPLTTNCCTIQNQTIFGNLKPSSSDTSNDIAQLPNSFHWMSFSDLGHFLSIRSNEDQIAKSFASDLYDFQLSDLRAITQNFSNSFWLGEGGFGTVHKGYIDANLRRGLKAQPVAVKILNVQGLQGHREWLAEVIFLGQLRHKNLVKLIGYCYEDEERLLIYEFMPRGSLENHLFRRKTSLPWATRLKITIGAAKGLAFLHAAKNPVIFRDFKTSNILLDSRKKDIVHKQNAKHYCKNKSSEDHVNLVKTGFHSQTFGFGLARLVSEGSKSHVTTRVWGNYGYAAPEYISKGHLTTKSDVYSFGVVLIELLTGRRAIDKKRPKTEQNLVDWSKPYLSNSKRLRCIMDPRLVGQYSVKGAKEMALLALQCTSLNPKDRPRIQTAVETLENLQKCKDMAVTYGHWPQCARNGASNKVKIDLRAGGNHKRLSPLVSGRTTWF
ncbi:putative serine/threonine-protein kinase PBL15 isoform C [Glycine soja]|uniref:non-specific serine/threonine protein kinase n=1 Tax=Glycine soja TaxID=3848 RepID=A0A445GH27_GLYSO|nr:putative serine/threonine-protein kinase PBL15 isoform A [Glycine soja]RZB60488.1 putative serine/threonine-protein kinase PBL15 isoform B [Glycine soja]RZB60489.1 putative serine/threonine-protein kinase PBL15 isoform C [Glycine soja]